MVITEMGFEKKEFLQAKIILGQAADDRRRHNNNPAKTSRVSTRRSVRTTIRDPMVGGCGVHIAGRYPLVWFNLFIQVSPGVFILSLI